MLALVEPVGWQTLRRMEWSTKVSQKSPWSSSEKQPVRCESFVANHKDRQMLWERYRFGDRWRYNSSLYQYRTDKHEGMVEVNNVAGDFGVSGVADGVIDREVDQEANKLI